MKMVSVGVVVVMLAGMALPAFAAQGGGRRRPGASAKDEGANLASHQEVQPIGVSFKKLSSLRLHPSGNLLACDLGGKEIKIISPAGRQVGSIKPGFGPEAINVDKDGTIYTGGEGKLAKIDRNGRVVKLIQSPANVGTANAGRRRSSSRGTRISGIAISDKDVFITFGSGWSTGSKSKLFRFDKNLGSSKLLAEGLRGCCQRCDLAFKDGVLYLAENAVHRVVRYDREGKKLGSWGARARTGLEGFGSCCNPMNLSFGGGKNVIYTAESGLGRVKRFSLEGKFLGLVGYVGVERFSNASGLAASCSNIAIAATPDGKRVYVMDYKNNVIRVLQKK